MEGVQYPVSGIQAALPSSAVRVPSTADLSCLKGAARDLLPLEAQNKRPVVDLHFSAEASACRQHAAHSMSQRVQLARQLLKRERC
jgi:hypothetical protein